MSTQIHSLTMANTGLAKVIVSPIKIKNTFTNDVIETHGIWDTGATDSVITKSAAATLGLTTIRKAEVNGVHGKKEVNVYHVNLTLNNERISVDTLVTECEELSADSSINFLIGMNIINLGDFAITNYQGETMMSFRIPSLQKIDFVQASKNTGPYIKNKIPGRNDPCQCGSGKKYKNCHGK